MASLNAGKSVRNYTLCNSEDQFLTNCLTIKGVGLWAADLLGMGGSVAADYAHSLVVDVIDHGGLDDIGRKIHADFQEWGIEVSDHRIGQAFVHHKEIAERIVALRCLKMNAAVEERWDRRVRTRNARPPVIMSETETEPLLDGFLGLLSSLNNSPRDHRPTGPTI
ncbi:MAG: ATPase inhibitor subunit zeta [Rhodospirillaceae bacterium]